MEGYSEIIKENIEYDSLLLAHPYDQEMVEGIFDLILETVLSKNGEITIAGDVYPKNLVKSKFLKLNYSHVEYVINLYDWCNMLSEGLFEEQRDLFRKCFLFYMTISADTLNKSFDTSAIDTLDFNKIRRDLFPVLNKKDNFQLDERKKIAKNYISDLMVLNTKEKEYIDRFEEKKYMPELLFEDAEIVERVKNHPMALWKCKE